MKLKFTIESHHMLCIAIISQVEIVGQTDRQTYIHLCRQNTAITNFSRSTWNSISPIEQIYDFAMWLVKIWVHCCECFLCIFFYRTHIIHSHSMKLVRVELHKRISWQLRCHLDPFAVWLNRCVAQHYRLQNICNYLCIFNCLQLVSKLFDEILMAITMYLANFGPLSGY